MKKALLNFYLTEALCGIVSAIQRGVFMGEFYLSTDCVLTEGHPINQQIYGFLRRAIIECRLLPDDPLSENDVAAAFKISRQPVREALIKLAENDFVIICPKKATKVRRISKSHVLQGIFIRRNLESAVIAQCAGDISAATLQKLRELIERQEDAATHYRIHEHFALDDEFHSTILLSAGFDRVLDLVLAVKGAMDRVRFLSIENEVSPIGRTCTAHRRILSALQKRDPQAAAAAMAAHMQETSDSLEKVITRSNPLFFED